MSYVQRDMETLVLSGYHVWGDRRGEVSAIKTEDGVYVCVCKFLCVRTLGGCR